MPTSSAEAAPGCGSSAGISAAIFHAPPVFRLERIQFDYNEMNPRVTHVYTMVGVLAATLTKFPEGRRHRREGGGDR